MEHSLVFFYNYSCHPGGLLHSPFSCFVLAASLLATAILIQWIAILTIINKPLRQVLQMSLSLCLSVGCARTIFC